MNGTPTVRYEKRATKAGIAWRVVIEAGRHPGTGKRQRIVRSGFPTKTAARGEAREIVNAIEDGMWADRSAATVAEYLDGWLPGHARAAVRPNTRANYAAMIRGYVTPHIGAVRLEDLTPDHVTELYGLLLREGRRRDDGPLAPKTVRNVHLMLHRALEDAVREGRIRRNPAGAAKPPSARKAQRPPAAMRTWTREEAQRFLRYVTGDRLEALYVAALSTGMRRSELLGLRWRDLDLDAGRLSVVQTVVDVDGVPTFSTPKTERSQRAVALDPRTVAALRDHYRRQAAERLAWGDAYQQHGWCCPTRTGRIPLHWYRAGSIDSSPTPGFPASRSTSCGTRGRRWRSRPGCTRRSCRNGLGIHRSRSRWTRTRMCSPGCSEKRPRRSLTSSSDRK